MEDIVLNTKEIVDRLLLLHKEKNVKSLSNAIDISYNTMNGWIKKNNIPMEFLYKVSKKFNTNLDWLLTGQGNMLSGEQKKYSLVPVAIEINAIPRIASALKTKLDEVVELLSEDIYEQNLSLRELQLDDSSIPDIHIPYSDILDEILALYKQRKDGAGNPEFKSQNIAEKINALKLDYQRSIKHEYKIGTLLRHWTSILEQEFKTSFE